MKRGTLIAFSFAFILLLSAFVVAQDAEVSAQTDSSAPASDSAAQQTDSASSDTDSSSADADASTSDSSISASTSSTAVSDDPNVQLAQSAGITPDSGLYFVEDKILSKFRNDIDNREKKIAEVQQMVREGKTEDARKALERYNGYADNLEKNVKPEDKEKAQRSASAIRNTIKDFEKDIAIGDKKEFIDDVKDKEGKISTAAEIAAKIKDLCEQLSTLDPNKYAQVCTTKNDAPKWQKNLDQKLTKEQEKEAEAFFSVMSSCMKSPEDCECEKITIKSFADECSIVAPLAAKCSKGDKSACEEMDSREDPSDLLPPHLQHVFERIEGQYSDAEFENHFPEECREAGAKTKDDCMKVMFELNAPEECIEAAKAGKIDFKNEKQARMACEEIMFAENAPEECIAAGLKDHKECGKFMFQQNAPEECIAAGLTGERPSDGNKCRKLMEAQFGKPGENEGQGRGQGFGFGKDCSGIQDSAERLKCFDEASSNVQRDFQGQGPGGKEGMRQGNFPPECQEAGATTPDACRKIMEEFGRQQHPEGENQEGTYRDFREGDQNQKGQFQQPQDRQGQFNQGNPPCNSPEECAKMFGGQPPQGQFQQGPPPGDFGPPVGDHGPMTGDQGPPQGMQGSPAGDFSPSTDDKSPSAGSSPSPSPESAPSSSSAPLTGGVIFDFRDNSFLNYYYS